jgi:hypothetical protein
MVIYMDKPEYNDKKLVFEAEGKFGTAQVFTYWWRDTLPGITAIEDRKWEQKWEIEAEIEFIGGNISYENTFIASYEIACSHARKLVNGTFKEFKIRPYLGMLTYDLE